MTTIKLNIDAKYLRFAALFAANKDIRPCLNGVNVQLKNGKIVLAATDGGIMSIIDAGLPIGGPEAFNFTIPPEAIKGINKKALDVQITFGQRDGTISEGNIMLSACGTTQTCVAVGGKYPEFSRVIPDTVSGECGFYASKYYVLIDKAQKVLIPGSKDDGIRIWQNGKSGAGVVDFNNANICVVVMPCRMGDDTYSRPGFTR